jgi:hypothetical protein
VYFHVTQVFWNKDGSVNCTVFIEQTDHRLDVPNSSIEQGLLFRSFRVFRGSCPYFVTPQG